MLFFRKWSTPRDFYDSGLNLGQKMGLTLHDVRGLHLLVRAIFALFIQ